MTLDTERKALIVLGMHRSGTSAMAAVLSMLGADPGLSLSPGQDNVNPKGFWEHAGIVVIHEQLLKALGSSWHDERPLPDHWWEMPTVAPFREKLKVVVLEEFSQSPLWLLKDPRLCKLLPMWLGIFDELGVKPRFVISLRDPWEVAKSLERRDGLPQARSALLWTQSLLDAERWTRGYPRVIATYDQLLIDWKSLARHIAKNLLLPLHVDVPDVADEVDKFLEPALRHHHVATRKSNGDPIACLADEAYQIATTHSIDQYAKAFVPTMEKVAALNDLITPWVCQIHVMDHLLEKLKVDNEQLLQENTCLQSEIYRIKSTVSWRVSKPLRLIAYLLRQLRMRI